MLVLSNFWEKRAATARLLTRGQEICRNTERDKVVKMLRGAYLAVETAVKRGAVHTNAKSNNVKGMR